MKSKLNKLLSIFKPSSLDPTTEAGRAAERERRIALSSLVSTFSRALGAAVSLMTVPLTLHYLGVERYGLWMAISSVIALMSFADFGIGNGLLNVVAKAHGNDNQSEIKEYFTSATIMLTGIAMLILAAFSIIYAYVDWASLFNVHSALAISESGQAVAVFMICFALNIPITLIQRLQLGLQMGFVANLWQGVGSIFSLIAVLAAVRFEAGLPWLVVALAGAPILAAICNGFYFFGRVRRDLMPRCNYFSKYAAKVVAKTGMLFFVLQFVVAVTYSSDNFIITRTLGIGSVTEYAVTERMFSLIPLILSTLLAPLWPAYGEAMARNDMCWVKKTLKKSLFISLFASVLISTIFVLGGHQILKVWVGNAVVPSMALLIGFAIWKVIESLGSTVAIFLNGANVVRAQVIVGLVTAVCATILKISLIHKFGIVAILFSNSITYIMLALVPYYFIMKKKIFF